MDSYSSYYEKLLKPSWAPAVPVFGVVWSVLYVIIAITFGTVFIMGWQKQITFMIMLPFILNLFFNIIYTPIQFGLRNNSLASFDIILILATLVWATIAIYPHSHWIAYAQVPYLVWVCIATALQFSITYLNR